MPLGYSAADKLQQIIDRAVDNGATSVTIEYAQEGGLEVCFMYGNTGEGGIPVDSDMEGQVMDLIVQQAGLDKKSSGVLHCTTHGKEIDIQVEEYDSFGETAFTLTLPV